MEKKLKIIINFQNLLNINNYEKRINIQKKRKQYKKSRV